MPVKPSFRDVFRASGQKMLRDALSETNGGLLDEFSCYAVGSNRAASQESENAEAPLMKAREIDYHRTSDEMIVDGDWILRDGRRVQGKRWQS